MLAHSKLEAFAGKTEEESIANVETHIDKPIESEHPVRSDVEGIVEKGGGPISTTQEDGPTQENTIDEELLVLLDKAERLGKDDKLLDAARLLENVDKDHLRPIHVNILREAQLMKQLIEETSSPVRAEGKSGSSDANIPDSNEWIKQGECHGLHNFSIYYKLSQSHLQCRIETPIDPSLLVPILSVLNESELYSTWLPCWEIPRLKVIRSEKLRQIGRCSQIIVVETAVPWPLASREVILKAVACDDIEENKRILVRIQSMDCKDNAYLREEEGLEIEETKNVRLEVEGGFLFVKCPPDHSALQNSKKQHQSNDDEEKVLVVFSFYVDPKLQGIPKPFVNFFTRTVMGQMWNMFLRVATDIKDGKRPMHSNAIDKKKDLYEWVELRTRAMLDTP